MLPKHNSKKGKARPSLAIRIAEWPVALPVDKSLLFKDIKDNNRGETNVPTMFRSIKQKALVVYIDALDKETQQRVLMSKHIIASMHVYHSSKFVTEFAPEELQNLESMYAVHRRKWCILYIVIDFI